MKVKPSLIGYLFWLSALLHASSIRFLDAEYIGPLSRELISDVNRLKSSINPKLGPILTGLVKASKDEGEEKRNLDNLSREMVRMVGNKVLVEVVGNTADDLLNTLSENGVDVISCIQRLCSAYVAVDQLEKIANLKQVEFLHPSSAVTNTGRLTSEGDKSIYADVVRSKFGVNGTGIMVGVISNSYNCLGGAATNIFSGDLPSGSSNILILSDLNANECASFNITFADEGRAMMQVIHDVAPGARLAFHTGIRGIADFAAGIKELANAGCDIIVDDITYVPVPFFQDGILAQAVDAVVKRGVTYFSAAGNFGRHAWDEPTGFRPSGIDEGFGEYHQFVARDGTTEIGQMFIPLSNAIYPDDPDDPKNMVYFLFQWDSPNYSVSGPPGCATDMDIFVLLGPWATMSNIVASGVANNTGKDAYEYFSLNLASLGQWIPGDYPKLEIRITHVSGPFPKYMKLLVFIDGFSLFTGSPTSDTATIFGHANSELGAAVGAVNWYNTPAWSTPAYLWQASSSSAGGTPILLDTRGNRLSAPVIRKQPRFTGPEGVATTCFDQCFDDYLRVFIFSGTSAAATHVAAVAALMLGYKKQLSPLKIYDAMEKTAIDMDDGATGDPDAGFDFGTGWGLVNASAAFELIDTTDTPSIFEIICFSDRNTVEVLRRHRYVASLSESVNSTASSSGSEIIPISELAIGDFVLTAPNLYTQVISFCHKHPNVNARFVQIHRSILASSVCIEQRCFENETVHQSYGVDAMKELLPALEMSADHMVHVIQKDTAPLKGTWSRAQDVQVGDILVGLEGQHQIVSAINSVERTGVYAPITEDGTLYVSGSLASSYVAVLQKKNMHVSAGNKTKSMLLFSPNMQHLLGHSIMTPLRLLCRYDFAKYCLNEIYDPSGYTWYSKLIMNYVLWFEWGNEFANHHELLEKWISLVNLCVTIFLSFPFILLNGLDTLLRNDGSVWIMVVSFCLMVFLYRKRSPFKKGQATVK